MMSSDNFTALIHYCICLSCLPSLCRGIGIANIILSLSII
uniref:Uncharacterized protein n=1 Tax=Anguilla anguilla TaxID=7936 RepID=A0A0E9VAD8_ANGAN